MLEKKLTVDSSSGIHARSARVITETVAEYDSEVKLINENAEADAGSILELMMLAAAPGTPVTVRVNGVDEEKTLSAIENLFANNFYREENHGE